MFHIFPFLLRIFHFIYSVILAVRAFWQTRKTLSPQPLTANRRRIPQHLAVVFTVASDVSTDVAQKIAEESVSNIVGWCRTVGVKRLTVYEQHGRLSQCAARIREVTPGCIAESESSESETEYLLTPPPSDYSESRPLSPDRSHPITSTTLVHIPSTKAFQKKSRQHKLLHKRHVKPEDTPIEPELHSLTVVLASQTASKSSIAAVAESLLRSHRYKTAGTKQSKSFSLSINELNSLLEDEAGLTSPDFMILYPISCRASFAPPELHNFPPWHIRLTEIYEARPQLPSFWSKASNIPPIMDEPTFCGALDEFASAEMRFGR